MRASSFRTALLGAALLAFAAGNAALADEMKFRAELSGGEEVPPVETSASGTADVTYNSANGQLTWVIEYSDLSGSLTAAHFHGPAAPGENAPPVVPIEVEEGPLEGSAEITAEQAEGLMAGRWYVNLHTEANPQGEIRGQVVQAE